MQLFHGQLTTFSCNQCTYKSSTEPDLEKHKSVEHKESQFRNDRDRDVRSNSNSFEKKRFFNYWNYSSCDFGDNCKYSHEEIPSCRFQEKCNKENCYFFTKSADDPENGTLPQDGLNINVKKETISSKQSKTQNTK